MTENKRFKTIVDNKVLDEFFCVPVFEYDEYLGHIAYGDDKIVDRLNEVHEINGRCNREITLNHQKILKLMNENEELKSEIDDLKQALIKCAFDERGCVNDR